MISNESKCGHPAVQDMFDDKDDTEINILFYLSLGKFFIPTWIHIFTVFEICSTFPSGGV